MFDMPRRIMLIGRIGQDREPMRISLGRTALSLFSTALLLGVAAAGHAQTTIQVTTTMDGSIPGECTLRDAIRASNTDTAVAGCPAGSAEDVIQLQAGATYVLTVVDADGSTDLDIGPGVYVPPPSPASLQIQGHGATIDGNGTGRVLHCLYTSLDLHDLTLTGGSVPGGADPTNLGGGLLIDSFGAAVPGTLTGHDVRVTGNFARNSGGAIMVLSTNAELHAWSISNNMSLFGSGGADINMRDLPLSVSLRDCTISGNAGGGAGGGLFFTSRNQSQVAGHWELIGSTVSGNTAGGGGGISMSLRRDEAAIRGTSVTDNVSSGTGGGLIALANASTADARVEIVNSTFSRNTAIAEGGGLHLLGSSGPIDVAIRGSVISDNSARGGGGIVAVGPRLLANVTQTSISGNRALPTSSAATGVGGGVLNVDSNTVLTSVTLTGNSASGNPAFLQGLGGAVVNVARGLAGTASHLSLLRSEVFGNDASLADGVATVKTHPSFTAETVFGRTSICEEADTCVSNVPLPTSQVSLGNNLESDDKCGFTRPTDNVFVACDAPQPGILQLDTADFLPLLDAADAFPLLAGAEDEAMPAGMEALPEVR